jgi:hypothetical protein
MNTQQNKWESKLRERVTCGAGTAYIPSVAPQVFSGVHVT